MESGWPHERATEFADALGGAGGIFLPCALEVTGGDDDVAEKGDVALGNVERNAFFGVRFDSEEVLGDALNALFIGLEEVILEEDELFDDLSQIVFRVVHREERACRLGAT